jgi:hypothetical protein
VDSICSDFLDFEYVIEAIDESLQILFCNNLLAGLVQGLLALPLAILVALTVLTDAIATNGCDVGLCTPLPVFFLFLFSHSPPLVSLSSFLTLIHAPLVFPKFYSNFLNSCM